MPHVVGPSDIGSSDPGTDPGGGLGYAPPPYIPPPPPAPPPSYVPSGPSKRGPAVNSTPQAAANDPWKDIPGAIHDQATAMVEKFMSTVGWPKGVDANQAALKLATYGSNITGAPMDAFQYLYNNVLSHDQQVAMPWAQFGMIKDEYEQTKSKLAYTYFDLTGLQAEDPTWGGTFMWQAIHGGWNPDEIRNYVTYGNAQGGSAPQAAAQFGGDMPWLSAGQTYTQTLQGFQSFEGHAPQDRATLASWWRFGANARQLGSGTEAVGSASRQLVAAGSEVR